MAYNAAADSAFISVPLQRTGADTNASGLVTVSLGSTNSSMTLLASNLTPRRTYTAFVGGVERGRFVTDARGRGGLGFVRPATTGTLPFDFDPRGHQVLVVDRSQIVLRARISGSGEPRGSIVDEQVHIPAVPGTAGGRADARYELTASGTRRFTVALTNVGDATFTVFVNGIRRGNVVTSGGSGSVVFGPPLNFDPRGVVIDIAKGPILRFSGKFKAKADGISAASPALITRVIPGTAVAPSGVALARRWTDRDARREFDVELFNVPVGDYELYANGVFQGFIPVVASAIGTEGEIQFSTDADDEDERPLTFDPFRSFYTVLGGGGLFFQGQAIVPGTQITNTGVMPTEIELPLFNRGVDADGTARAQMKTDDRGRRHFEVELKDVPRGDYSLLINDVPFGTISVINDASGTRGIIEYEDEPELGELPLNFDPRGTVMAIDRGRTRYFERGFPAAR
ncbi:MAG TPA: hypothetical protein VJ063_18475 [Verrucomicrobiae bacterium]|nr:hypothetical protein [Verrucomicrobiae bacterium]